MASLVFSIGPAILGYIAYDPVAKDHAPLLIIPLLALALNVIMFAAYRRKRKFLRNFTNSNDQTAAEISEAV